MKNKNVIWLNIIKIVGYIIIIFVPATTCYALTKDCAATSIFATLSVLCVLLINIKYLKSLKVLGIETELKETIDEAYATIEQMKKLQKVDSATILDLICKRRFIFSNNIESNFKSIIQIYNLAKENNNESDIYSLCEQAMICLISSELSEVIGRLNFGKNKENKAVLSKHYQYSLNENLLTTNKLIPTYEALCKVGCIKDDSNNEHAKDYCYAINEYKKIFGDEKISNEINIEKIKKRVTNEIQI